MFTTRKIQSFLNRNQISALKRNIGAFLTMHPTTNLKKGFTGELAHLRKANSDHLAELFLTNIKKNNFFVSSQYIKKIAEDLQCERIDYNQLKTEVKYMIDDILISVVKEKNI